jgi:hypothetical protein
MCVFASVWIITYPEKGYPNFVFEDCFFVVMLISGICLAKKQ